MAHWINRFAAVLVLVAVALAPTAGEASLAKISKVATGTGTIEGKEVSAWVAFRVVEGKLQIKLKNTGPRADYTPAQGLSDISFDLNFQQSGADFHFKLEDEETDPLGFRTGSSVKLPTSSSVYAGPVKRDDIPYNDVSCEWGLATQTVLDGISGKVYDYSVTSTAFENEVRFAEGNLAVPPSSGSLDGADFSLLSNAANAALDSWRNSSPNEDSFRNAIVDSVTITLAATRDLGDDDLEFIQNITFSYGSLHTGLIPGPDFVFVVPEPASLLIWSLVGLAWGGSAWCSRRRTRRRKSQA